MLLDEAGQQEPFLLDEPVGKQAAQKGRNNKKQILVPGALRQGAQMGMPGLSELLEGAQGKKGGTKPQGMAKSKGSKNKQPSGGSG